MFKFFKKSAKIFLIFFFIAVFGFSNLGPLVLNLFGQNQLADNLEIKQAQAANRVQSLSCSNGGATTINCALISAPVNGNAIFAVIGTRGTTVGRVTSISQTGATWTKAIEVANANGVTSEIWYALNVASAGTGITVNLAASLKASAIIAEYADIVNSNALDKTASLTGSSASPSTGTTVATAQANEVWIGGISAVGTPTYSAQTNGFLEVAESASTGGSTATRNNAVFEEKIVSAAGTAGVAATLSASAQWAGAIATFKAKLLPDAVSYANNTEGTLADGGRISQQITISGTSLAGGGTVTNKDNCAAGVSNGCVRIANYTVPAADISTWTDTQITFTIPSSITVYGGSGTACGGADGNGVCVTQDGKNDSGGSLTFYVYPDVASISPSGAGEGREGASITISGNRFGSVQGTGSVKFQNCAIAGDQTATVGSWSDASISTTVPAGIDDNDDSCNVLVTRDSGSGSKTDTSANFKVLPSIVSMNTCSAGGGRDNICGSNQAPEYSAADTWGLIQLNGNHLGTAAGTINFTGGISFAVHNTAEGACSVAGWAVGGTSVCAEVNSTIADTTNSGTITLTRTGDSKTDTVSLQVLPRISSATPASGIAGSAVTIDGNHFCQTGTCPVSPPDADYIVYFGATQALSSDFVSTGDCVAQGVSWSNTRICVKVPSGIPSGVQNIKAIGMASPLRESERENFTVASTGPNAPSNLIQYKSNGVTVISQNSGTNESTVVLEGALSAGTSINMFMEIELKSIVTPFDGTNTASSTICANTTSCSRQITISSLSNGTEYHWRARTKNSDTLETSGWISYGTNADGERDFYVDIVAPAISGVGTPPDNCTAHSGVTDNSAAFSWTVSDFNSSITNEIRYGTDSTLSVYNTAAATSGTNPNASLSGLNANTDYYYQARSTDAVNNLAVSPGVSPYCKFTTQPVQTRLMKTLEFFIGQSETAGNNLNKNFDIFLSESNSTRINITFKSIIIEVFGLSSVTSGDATIGVNLNGAGATNYILSNPGTNSNFWTLSHSALNINYDCSGCSDTQNSLDVIVSGTGASTSLLGARAIITYFYTPQ